MPEVSDDADPSCVLIRNELGLIIAAQGDVFEVLGWTPDELLGCASTTLIHPEDQTSAITAWLIMIDAPGATATWRGRYRSREGNWRWVESLNTNHLDDPTEPRVISSLRPVAVEQVGIEEELRSRKQLISRLSDSLPVGLFQIDLRRHLTFTNDRLHTIIQTPAAATTEAQFAAVHPDDRESLETALAAVLADELVDDLELRFLLPNVDGGERGTRVCLLSLRSLTDSIEVVTGAIGCVSDVTDSVRLRRELQIRANVDALTGCLNRSATLELLELAVSRRSTHDEGLAVIFVDLDDFKSVNDHYGHATGDAVLVAASRRMRAGLRSDDQVGRLGGDEFLVICPNVPSLQHATDVAGRLDASIQGTVAVDGHTIELRAALGLAWTREEVSPDDLVAHADQAMYKAKQARREAQRVNT
ncbi:MAG TPA: diguanylate cyclase [Acidimicrobiia bacterium]|jgi:diguanylate cyclase (GGDEF)-like protein|nr:diguanylate cyclase [Acidimicrobiia bacterium]